ncbi:MAG: hypothetical protein ACQEP8_01065 [Chlamydiota bacterium]
MGPTNSITSTQYDNHNMGPTNSINAGTQTQYDNHNMGLSNNSIADKHAQKLAEAIVGTIFSGSLSAIGCFLVAGAWNFAPPLGIFATITVG